MLSSLALLLLALAARLVGAAAARDELAQHVAADGVVYADDAVVEAAFAGARDFTVALLLTSDSPRVDCQYCRVLAPHFQTLAASYDAQLGGAERELFFVLADLDSAMATFKTLGITHVPNLAFYPPTKSRGDARLGLHGPHAFASFVSGKDDVDSMAAVFAKHGFPIAVVRPFPVARAARAAGTLATVAAAALFFREPLLAVWQSKKVWLALSLMCVIMFVSGHMYNVTRGTPFMGFDGAALTLVEPGFGSQLAVETQIVASLYAVLAFSTIALLKFVPKLATPAGQTVGALAGAALVLVAYSVLLETFKIKLGPFPLTLLPLKLF